MLPLPAAFILNKKIELIGLGRALISWPSKSSDFTLGLLDYVGLGW